MCVCLHKHIVFFLFVETIRAVRTCESKKKKEKEKNESLTCATTEKKTAVTASAHSPTVVLSHIMHPSDDSDIVDFFMK